MNAKLLLFSSCFVVAAPCCHSRQQKRPLFLLTIHVWGIVNTLLGCAAFQLHRGYILILGSLFYILSKSLQTICLSSELKVLSIGRICVEGLLSLFCVHVKPNLNKTCKRIRMYKVFAHATHTEKKVDQGCLISGKWCAFLIGPCAAHTQARFPKHQHSAIFLTTSDKAQAV